MVEHRSALGASERVPPRRSPNTSEIAERERTIDEISLTARQQDKASACPYGESPPPMPFRAISSAIEGHLPVWEECPG